MNFDEKRAKNHQTNFLVPYSQVAHAIPLTRRKLVSRIKLMTTAYLSLLDRHPLLDRHALGEITRLVHVAT
jgi:hypothetical protein